MRYPVGNFIIGGIVISQKYTYEIGAVYGVKKLIGFITDKNGRRRALVKCVNCGRESIVRPDTLHHKENTSCTCMYKRLGGRSNTRLYGVFHNMLYRCNTPTAQGYCNYGGRGIKVCDAWSQPCGFLLFEKWALEHGYRNGLTIDRINVNGDYSPDNCRWVTLSENVSAANRDKRVQHRHANRGRYYGFSPDGTYYEFDNANAFAAEHELSASIVRRSANHGGKTHGWIFGFVQDLNKEPLSTIESRDTYEQVEYTPRETRDVEAPGTVQQ